MITMNLKDIVDELEVQSDEHYSYLNKKTGEIVMVTSEEFRAAENEEPLENYPEWQQENIQTAKEILDEDEYVALPTKFDVHEWGIMEKFSLSIDDEEISDELYNAIHGKGAFRMFRDAIYRLNIADEWYAYKSNALKEIARRWCEANNISFVDKDPVHSGTGEIPGDPKEELEKNILTYLKDPGKIEAKSMEIIEAGIGKHSFSSMEFKVVKRIIHTTGDFEYKKIVSIKQGAIEAGIEAIKSGCRIVTDTKMAFAGINKRVLEKANCKIHCYITHEEVFKSAKDHDITRSMAAMDLAAREGVDIFVIGNAPTALYRIGELIQENTVVPKLIIGVPVGFVGAAESKEYIRSIEVPSITTIGTKGGSNVAASIINAIIYMAVGRE